MKSWHDSQVCCEDAPGITHLLDMRELGLLVIDINNGSLECGTPLPPLEIEQVESVLSYLRKWYLVATLALWCGHCMLTKTQPNPKPQALTMLNPKSLKHIKI